MEKKESGTLLENYMIHDLTGSEEWFLNKDELTDPNSWFLLTDHEGKAVPFTDVPAKNSITD